MRCKICDYTPNGLTNGYSNMAYSDIKKLQMFSSDLCQACYDGSHESYEDPFGDNDEEFPLLDGGFDEYE